MKRYALLLGMLLTVGSGYTAQVAVSSVGAGGRGDAGAAPASREHRGLDTVWYGGVLEPVTVEARGDAPAKTAAARRLLFDRPIARCFRTSRA